MTKYCTKQRKSLLVCCRNGCLILLLIHVILIFIICLVWTCIAESTIFLKTENISLVKTSDYSPIVNDPRTAVVVNGLRFDNNIPHGARLKGEIVLKESDDFLALIKYSRMRGLNIHPRWEFSNETYFSFYRISKEETKDKSWKVKTELLGSIHTNLYGAWKEHENWDERFHDISISPDSKSIVMSARGANTYSLGKFRNKEVLLVWEIGDNVVEKDIVDSTGKKIPIIIKTEEEWESE